MIESIRHKGLKLFWEKGDPSKLPAAYIHKIKLILTLLHNATIIENVNFPGSGLHALKGELTGFWAVKVSGNYRIIFRFADENMLDIDYVDYH